MEPGWVLGVTGGIGAGKSAVLQILAEQYHAYLISSDEVGRRLLEAGAANYQEMIRILGCEILTESGEIDRKKAAKKMFRDPKLVRQINEATHPKVKAWMEMEICRVKRKEPNRGIVLESALLKEGKLSQLCDQVWAVTANQELRIARLMQSRGYDREHCEQIMQRQKKQEEYEAEADVVLVNEGDLKALERQVAALISGC